MKRSLHKRVEHLFLQAKIFQKQRRWDCVSITSNLCRPTVERPHNKAYSSQTAHGVVEATRRRKTTSTSWTPTSASSWRRIRPRCDHWEGDATTWACHTNGDHPQQIKDGVSIECHSEHYVPLVEVARKKEVPACVDTPLASEDAGGVCVAEWLQPFTEGHMDESKS